MSVLQASKKFAIPRSTLRDKLKTGTTDLFRVDPQTVFGEDIEMELEQWLLDITSRGAPIPVEGLRFSVKRICTLRDISAPFKDNLPERKWVSPFMNRHPVLSIKKANIFRDKEPM